MINKTENQNLTAQKELYRIAEKQHATNTIMVDRSNTKEERLFFKRNDASKTATLTMLINKEETPQGAQVTKSNQPKDLNVALQTVIDKHNNPSPKDSYVHKREQLSNAVNNLDKPQALKKHPELKPFYSAQPMVREESSQMPQRLQDKFIAKSNSKLLDSIAKRTVTNEKINNRTHKALEKEIER